MPLNELILKNHLDVNNLWHSCVSGLVLHTGLHVYTVSGLEGSMENLLTPPTTRCFLAGAAPTHEEVSVIHQHQLVSSNFHLQHFISSLKP